MNHLYFGSEINSVSISGKTVEEADKQMTAELQNYALDLRERGGKNEQIRGPEIGLIYDAEEVVKNLKQKQKPFKWVLALFNKDDTKITEKVTYDKELLKQRVDELTCFESSNIVEPQNPSFKYADNSYTIVNEVNGSKVDKDSLYQHLEEAIPEMESDMDLEALDCYVKPQYTSKSQKVVEVKSMLDKYAASKITYTFGESREVIDGSIINKWISVNDSFTVTLDEGKAKSFLTALFDKYNTVGKTRSFKTTSGNSINIDGGDYGWSIDTSKETKDFIAAVKAGQTITKEPSYKQTAVVHGSSDIGNTYVEVDMTRQHLWFYKNGSLVTEGNVVTGNVSLNHTTPAGVYKLKYKERDKTLRGQGYASPVKFWMPFNGGIGLHDASWRSSFGGNIYKTNGSHGCVNCPYDVAKTIFENIQAGTPVVCYY